jgi:hypothetical protein
MQIPFGPQIGRQLSKHFPKQVGKQLGQKLSQLAHPPAPVLKTIDKVRSRIGKVHRGLVPRPFAFLEMVTAMWSAQALSVAATLGVADFMGEDPVSVDELARDVKANPDALYRLMRALSNHDVFEEHSGRRFRLTALGRCLRTDSPESMRSMAIFQGQYQWAHWGELLHSVRTGEPTVEKVRGVPLFDFMAKTPGAQESFDIFMRSVSRVETEAVLAAYSFAGSRTVADVGGGHGTFLAAILGSQPHLQGILMDQAHVVAGAEDELRAGLLRSRCKIVPGNFFDSVPKGADTYVMKHIVHDWDEKSVAKILKNIRAAIPKKKGKLVLVETVVPAPNTAHFSKLLDLEMLVAAGGRERTAEEYGELLAESGFRLTRVVATASAASVVEAEPR